MKAKVTRAKINKITKTKTKTNEIKIKIIKTKRRVSSRIRISIIIFIIRKSREERAPMRERKVKII